MLLQVGEKKLAKDKVDLTGGMTGETTAGAVVVEAETGEAAAVETVAAEAGEGIN